MGTKDALRIFETGVDLFNLNAERLEGLRRF